MELVLVSFSYSGCTPVNVNYLKSYQHGSISMNSCPIFIGYQLEKTAKDYTCRESMFVDTNNLVNCTCSKLYVFTISTLIFHIYIWLCTYFSGCLKVESNLSIAPAAKWLIYFNMFEFLIDTIGWDSWMILWIV